MTVNAKSPTRIKAREVSEGASVRGAGEDTEH